MVSPLIVGAGLNVLGSVFGSRSARRAARRQQQAAAQAAQRVQAYGQGAVGRAGELEQFLPEYQTVSPGQFRPVNISTGYGTTQYNPETGQYDQALSQPLAQQQQFSYGASQNLANQLGAFDPQAFAQQRYEGYQALMNPQREAATSDLLGSMKRKGLLGWSQTPVGGTSTERYNPLAAGFQRSIEEQNQALAQRSLGEGTAEQERLARLQQQMFSQGVDINRPLTEQMRYGYNRGDIDFNRLMETTGMANRTAEAGLRNRADLFSMTEPFRRQAELGGIDQELAAAGLMNQARLGQGAGMAQGIQNLGGMFFSGGGGQGGMPGMFNSYFNTSPSSAVSSEVSRLGGNTTNPFSDYWTGRGGWGSYGE